MGDPPTVGVSASEFTFNEDPSKLDGAAHLLWKGVEPMEMLDKVVEALETRPCDTWDPVFNDFPGVHCGLDSGNRRMFALRLPRVDVEGSGVGYHECEALMSFTNHISACSTTHGVGTTRRTKRLQSVPRGVKCNHTIATG